MTALFAALDRLPAAAIVVGLGYAAMLCLDAACRAVWP